MAKSNLPTNPTHVAWQEKVAAAPERTINHLFRHFANLYGTLWLDRWSGCSLEEVRAVWAAELAEVSLESIRLALKALDSAFPPSLPQFRALCRQFRPPLETGSSLHLVDKSPPNPEILRRIHDLLRNKSELLAIDPKK